MATDDEAMRAAFEHEYRRRNLELTDLDTHFFCEWFKAGWCAAIAHMQAGGRGDDR